MILAFIILIAVQTIIGVYFIVCLLKYLHKLQVSTEEMLEESADHLHSQYNEYIRQLGRDIHLEVQMPGSTQNERAQEIVRNLTITPEKVKKAKKKLNTLVKKKREHRHKVETALYGTSSNIISTRQTDSKDEENDEDKDMERSTLDNVQDGVQQPDETGNEEESKPSPESI